MQKDIHPKYHDDAKITCACGNKWISGSTMPELHVEICSNCHPFYTGNEKVLDTRGRIDRFKRRTEKVREVSSNKLGVKTKASKKKSEEKK